jgi:hypothetical protein
VRAGEPVAGGRSGGQVFDRDRRPYDGRSRRGFIGTGDGGPLDRLLERRQLRLEDHLLLTDGVILVVVGTLAEGARLPQRLRDLEAGAATQTREVATELLQTCRGHGRRPGGMSGAAVPRGGPLPGLAQGGVSWELRGHGPIVLCGGWAWNG